MLEKKKMIEKLKRDKKEREERREKLIERATPLLEFDRLESEFEEYVQNDQIVPPSRFASYNRLSSFCNKYEGFLRITFLIVSIDVLWMLIALNIGTLIDFGFFFSKSLFLFPKKINKTTLKNFLEKHC